MTAIAESPSAAEEVSGRLFADGLGGLHLLSVYVGHRLGLFRALAERPGSTSDERAATLGLDPRYGREWVQAEVIAGLVGADREDLAAADLDLAPGVAAALVSETDPAYIGGLGYALAAVGRVLPDLLAAFESGAGVPYEAYGTDGVHAQATMNRPSFVNDLASQWIPAVQDVDQRLRDTNQAARVADVGCGAGWAAIELARAFPRIRVDGFDTDVRSIALAKDNALAAGVADRAVFRVADATRGGFGATRYDLILFLESLHDMSHPADALAAARAAVADDGAVLVMDERVAETRPDPGDPIETFLALASTMWCLPQARVDPTSETPGAVMRPAMLESIATGAGWSGVDILPINHPTWRFYRLQR